MNTRNIGITLIKIIMSLVNICMHNQAIYIYIQLLYNSYHINILHIVLLGCDFWRIKAELILQDKQIDERSFIHSFIQ